MHHTITLRAFFLPLTRGSGDAVDGRDGEPLGEEGFFFSLTLGGVDAVELKKQRSIPH